MAGFIWDVLDEAQRFFEGSKNRERETIEVQKKLEELRKKHAEEAIGVVDEDDTEDAEGASVLDAWLDGELERIAADDRQKAEERLEYELKKLEATLESRRHDAKNYIGQLCFQAGHPFREYLEYCHEALLDSPKADACRRKLSVVSLICNYHKKLIDTLHWSEYLVFDEDGYVVYRGAKVKMKKLDKLVRYVSESA